jgi:hypothetical protein
MEETALNWLEKEFIKLESTTGVFGVMYELIEQAKEIEREQIEDAFQYGIWNGWEAKEGKVEIQDPTQYYNETFKNKTK